MKKKRRSPGNTAASISMPQSLLTQIDERAHALGLTRSQYLSQLARQDVDSRGPLPLREVPSSAVIRQADWQVADARVRIAKTSAATQCGEPTPGPAPQHIPPKSPPSTPRSSSKPHS